MTHGVIYVSTSVSMRTYVPNQSTGGNREEQGLLQGRVVGNGKRKGSGQEGRGEIGQGGKWKRGKKVRQEKKGRLECGPMPNVMVALSNIGGAVCSTLQSLADAY